MAEFKGLPLPQRYWSSATIWLALALSVLDGSIANVALPTIARELSAPAADAVWVINAYQLIIVALLLPLAALGDAIGHRCVFQAGLILFTLGSLGCSFAGSLVELTIARAVQGVGAACIMSENGALVRYTYPQNALGRALGLNALVASGAAALGPTVASAILAIAHWKWLFAVNVPIGLAASLIGRRSLPESPKSASLDVFGALLNFVLFGSAFIAIDLLSRGNCIRLAIGALILAAASGAGLILRSRLQISPIFPLDLLRNGGFSLAVVTSIASFTAQMLAFVLLPFYIQGSLHRDQVETGLLITPWPVAVGIAAPIAGRLADRISAAILCGAGLVVLAVGLALLALLPQGASTADILWRMALCGLGFGFFQAPNNRSMLALAPMARSGAAGGMLATARLTGQTAGATLAAVMFRLRTDAEIIGFAIAAILAGLASAASFARLRGREPPVSAYAKLDRERPRERGI